MKLNTVFKSYTKAEACVCETFQFMRGYIQYVSIWLFLCWVYIQTQPLIHPLKNISFFDFKNAKKFVLNFEKCPAGLLSWLSSRPPVRRFNKRLIWLNVVSSLVFSRILSASWQHAFSWTIYSTHKQSDNVR